MKPATLLATILLATVAVAHLLRLVYGWQVTVADAVIPMWASAVAFSVATFAAIPLWRCSRPRG